MLKPNCCFGVVMTAALVWAAAGTAELMRSAANVTARSRGTSMDPPPSEVHTVSDLAGLLDRGAGGRRAGFRHPPGQGGVVLVDRSVGVRSVEVRIAHCVER